MYSCIRFLKGLVKTPTAELHAGISDSEGLGGAGEFAFLTNSQVILMLLV